MILKEKHWFHSQAQRKTATFAKVGYWDEAKSNPLLQVANEFGMSSEDAFQQLKEALNMLEVDISVKREPVILVLDYEVLQVGELFLTCLLCIIVFIY